MEWLLSLLAAFLGIKWQTAAAENKSLKERLTPDKQKLYEDIIEFISNYLREGADPKQDLFKTRMISLEKRLSLIASNAVLIAFADWMQNFFDNSPNETKARRGLILYGNIILAMRADLGHKEWRRPLYWFDPVRLWLKDIRDILPSKYRETRSEESRKAIQEIEGFLNDLKS